MGFNLIKMKKIVKKLIPNKILTARNDYLEKKDGEAKLIKREKLYVGVDLVSHCNLNCQCCGHFSGIARPEFASVESFASDMKRLNELCVPMQEISLLGGEPLLHPKIEEFCLSARKYFPLVYLNIKTNGLLLPKQPDSFYETCANNDVTIIITKYPLKFDYDRVADQIRAKGVKVIYYGTTGDYIKTSWKMSLDLTGSQNPYKSFKVCPQKNNCIALKDGKIYTCETIACAKYFNEYFNQNLSVLESDSIDIYKIKSPDEIFSHLIHPTSFCRYCDFEHFQKDIPWNITQRHINEWAYLGKPYTRQQENEALRPK